MVKHRGAIEHDLLTKTGYSLDDVGSTLSWDALDSFIANCGADTALAREINEDYYNWSSMVKTNGILADIFDMLAQINANLVAIGTHKASKEPPKYPRPGDDRDNKNRKHFGNGAMAKRDFVAWIEERRQRHVRNA